MNKTYNVSGFNIKDVDKKKIVRWVLIAAAAIILIALVSTSFYTVSDKEVAVVTTFGKLSGIKSAGIHFKLPFGMQKAYHVAINEIKSLEIGYRSDTNASILEESMMITGDFNIVNIDFFVEYRISDPVQYLFAADDPESMLKMLIQSQIRNVIGSYEIDPILTGSKEEIQSKIKDLTLTELENYDIGLALVDIKIQDCEPPTKAVSEAFAAVKNADSGAKTAVNNANAYKNAKEAEAEAMINQILENAEYLKQARINEAKEEVAMFNAMYEEYAKYPEITRSRMYYEFIESVLPGVKVYIDASEGGTVKLLPLEEMIGGGN
ncbi:MAG: FtsH protease activity modulator HflK [Clostridia bacterium]|jgi:membrane protease subunit HflK|nr:FtsH protease activity modulator HflK [Clostridia bacterium]MBP5238184.1 FtsH protease activity modulator HflK [Clostridia bacterium]MBP5754649.1 FtsH protease activity modulator HflK [Clostridia bacterium]